MSILQNQTSVLKNVLYVVGFFLFGLPSSTQNMVPEVQTMIMSFFFGLSPSFIPHPLPI